MRILSRAIFAVVGLAAAFWLWTVLFPSPQMVIQSRLNKLAKTATFDPKEGNIPRMLKVDRLGTFFADEIELNVNVPGMHSEAIKSRMELKQAAMVAVSNARGISTEFVDMRIELNPDKQAAYVDLTLNARVGTENDPVVQVLRFNLKKMDGEWLITKVQTVNPLR